jgi:microcystin-dependent protein
MGQPYIGEIRLFAGNFAPQGWAFCNGQLLAISEFDALFNLIGTTYGGDGQTTFGLPDLQGRIPFHAGTGGGNTYQLAQNGGVEAVTLNPSQIPSHSHPPSASSNQGTASSPSNAVWAAFGDQPYSSAAPAAAMAAEAIGAAGGSQPHNNMPPFLAVSFIISLFGVFPTQN